MTNVLAPQRMTVREMVGSGYAAQCTFDGTGGQVQREPNLASPYAFRELRHHLKGMVGRSRNAQLGAFPHDVTVAGILGSLSIAAAAPTARSEREKVDLAWFAAREILCGR